MRAIVTKYLGPTDTKGSRVKATDGDGNTVVLPWDYAGNSDCNHNMAAVALCEKMGWHGFLQEGTLCKGGRSVSGVFVFVNPSNLLVV